MNSQEIFLAMFYKVVKEVFGEDIIYLNNKTRLMKLFILTIDKLGENIGYNGIPFAYGWYRHGLYSYGLHQTCSPEYLEQLLDLIPELNYTQKLKKIENLMKQVIKHLQSRFKMPGKDFDEYMHRDLPEDRIKNFYKAVDRVNKAFDLLLSNRPTLTQYFDMSKTDNLRKAIEQLENVVFFEFLKEEREKALYYYTDSLMLFLENYEDNDVCKEILKEMKDLFNEEVLSIISPYPESLKGNEKKKKEELEIHKKVLLNKIESLYEKIDNIESKYSNYFPTYDDLLNSIRNIKLDKELNDKISKILFE
ncbi:hypothetical protein [Methanocaldococcus sp.]